MKRTKQAAAVVTALALAATMAVPVWADVTHTPGNDLVNDDTKAATHDVNAIYNLQTVYHVDIEWADMSFTYEPGVWNPEATNSKNENVMGYEKATNGNAVGWNNTDHIDHQITITNRSNADVNISFSYESTAGSEYENRITGKFHTIVKRGSTGLTDTDAEINDNGIWMERADAEINSTVIGASGTSIGLDNAVDIGTASSANAYLILTGRPKNAIKTSTKIGEVTVTLSAADDSKTYSAYFPAKEESYQK